MHPTTTTATILVATLAALAPCATSRAQLPVAPDVDAKPRPIELPRFRSRAPERLAQGVAPTLLVLGLDGTFTTVDGADVPPPPRGFAAAVSREADRLAAPGIAVLVLADGQRLTGALDVDKGRPIWVSPWVAPRELDLASVRALVFPGGREPEATDEDVIELRNGDRVTGAVSSVLPDRIVVERGIGESAERLEVAMRDVLSVGIVGGRGERTGVRAWLQDGTVIDAPGAEWLGGDHLQFPSIRGAKLPVASVPRRLVAAVQSAPGAVLPLAMMAVEASHPAAIPPDRRRESIAPPSPADGTWPLDAPPLDLEGPVMLRFAGTESASNLACTVARPIAARAAGSPNLVIRSGGKEVVRERLGPDRAIVEVRAPLAPGPFEVELSSDDGSIAGCFAVLRRALVLPLR